MTHSISARFMALVCAAALGTVALGGCASGASTTATAEQQANRAYMSQVNETMVELDESLDQFVSAVSRGDVVNMRTQADEAYKVLDELTDIEAPEGMKEIRDNYVNGTAKLREALDAYITLYSDTAKSSSNTSADAYNKRISEIQATYDEGVELLKTADESAAGSSGSSSASASSQS